jgi:surface antigen
VASYKNVNWRGNANQWLRNARAKGHATGSTPTLGSIVVLNGRGYNPRYGHVAIVMEVKKDYLIVSDMNYRRLYEVTYRKIPINDRAIK